MSEPRKRVRRRKKTTSSLVLEKMQEDALCAWICQILADVRAIHNGVR